jgi:hypothetical protein
MRGRSRSEDRGPKTSYLAGARMIAALMIAALLFLVAGGFALEAQQGSSLADAARQARAQRQAHSKGDTNQAQQVVDQLAADQDDNNAPAGFKTYNQGAYKLWVPAPYTLDAGDDGGTVLTGPRVGTSQPLVLIGNPIVLGFGSSDDAFHDSATQFASGYAPSAHCNQVTVRDHGAYQCSLAGANLLGRSVSGNAWFLLDSGHIFPIFCVGPTDSGARDILNDPNSTYRSKMSAQRVLAQQEADVGEVWQKCETTFQSIRFASGARPPQRVAESTKARVEARRPDPFKPASTEQILSEQALSEQALSEQALSEQALSEQTSTRWEKTNGATAGGSGFSNASAGDMAQGAHPGATSGDNTQARFLNPEAVSPVPAGLKVHSFSYCNRRTQDCWGASIFVPSDAQLVSSDCKQFIFEMKVQGAPFMLLAGTGGADSCAGRTANDPSLVRWNQLAAPETALAPGAVLP